MSKNLSAKYYQENKETTKKALERLSKSFKRRKREKASI